MTDHLTGYLCKRKDIKTTLNPKLYSQKTKHNCSLKEVLQTPKRATV